MSAAIHDFLSNATGVLISYPPAPSTKQLFGRVHRYDGAGGGGSVGVPRRCFIPFVRVNVRSSTWDTINNSIELTHIRTHNSAHKYNKCSEQLIMYLVYHPYPHNIYAYIMKQNARGDKIGEHTGIFLQDSVVPKTRESKVITTHIKFNR